MKWKKWAAFAKNERNWQNHYERGLLKAEHVRDYILQLWFEEDSDVSIYELDFYPLIVEENPGGVFLPLKDKRRFRLVKGEYVLIWLNPETGVYDEKAVDLAPECIRYFCELYGKEIKIFPKKAA
ncbi:MAG TPA: hypothetical protein DCQ37_09980 [Desulfobacteraceae bacterium]|nr:hypothetical protein [Desulfobacteraceae bacterium]